MLEALRATITRPLTILLMGRGKLPDVGPGIEVISLGYIDHERTKVLAYNAADLFLHPACVDNLPNVVMESIACGTPVVAFPIGGVPDMVRPGVTGWLARELSGEALGLVIEESIKSMADGLNLRGKCREVAEAEYGDELQASRYVSLFEGLIAERRAPHA